MISAKRKAQLQAFIQANNWQGAELTPLKQDASFRQYFRLRNNSGKNKPSALVMDAPPPEKPVIEFAQIAGFLRQHGLHAPEIYAVDNAHGFLLLEDFGDATFTKLLSQQTDNELSLYQAATDILIQLHSIKNLSNISLAPYDEASLLAETALFIDWFFPSQTGKAASNAQIHAFKSAWQESFTGLSSHALSTAADADDHAVLVLRDYHVDNLMLIQQSKNALKPRYGILDFQDAVIGLPAYDVVSLFEDARRAVSEEVKAQCLAQYFLAMRAQTKNLDQAAFERDMNIFGAQRHAKVLGIFKRLAKRDNKPHYLAHLPHVLRLFQAAVEREPQLQAVANWMAENLPFDAIRLTA